MAARSVVNSLIQFNNATNRADENGVRMTFIDGDLSIGDFSWDIRWIK